MLGHAANTSAAATLASVAVWQQRLVVSRTHPGGCRKSLKLCGNECKWLAVCHLRNGVVRSQHGSFRHTCNTHVDAFCCVALHVNCFARSVHGKAHAHAHTYMCVCMCICVPTGCLPAQTGHQRGKRWGGVGWCGAFYAQLCFF